MTEVTSVEEQQDHLSLIRSINDSVLRIIGDILELARAKPPSRTLADEKSITFNDIRALIPR